MIYIRAQIVLLVDALSCAPVAAWRATCVITVATRQSPAPAPSARAQGWPNRAELRCCASCLRDSTKLYASALRPFGPIGSRHRDEPRLRCDFFVTSRDREFLWPAVTFRPLWKDGGNLSKLVIAVSVQSCLMEANPRLNRLMRKRLLGLFTAH